jgi:hypothetical protein
MPSISVVVPIYNVERYLRQCVDSLLAQTLKDIEIILVDDGSPDSSGAIADEYADTYDNVICIHQNNSGLGPARNTGIAHAHGDYIGFVDSDDWAEPQMFERLYREACRSDADIVVSGHCDVTDGKKTVCKSHPLAGQVLDHAHVMKIRHNLYGHGLDDHDVESFPMSVCMSIYRRTMVMAGSLQFHEILSEDVFFNLDTYPCAKRISFLGATDYCYRKEGQASITGSFKPGLLGRYEGFIALLASKAAEESDSEECHMRVCRTAVDYVRLYAGIVEQSNLSRTAMKSELARLTASNLFMRYASKYPHECLPRQQRIFQDVLEKEWYGTAIFLMHMRLWIKQRRSRRG